MTSTSRPSRDGGGAPPLRAPPRLHEPRHLDGARGRLLRRLLVRRRAPAAPVDRAGPRRTNQLNTRVDVAPRAGLAAVPRLRHQLRRVRLADVARRHASTRRCSASRSIAGAAMAGMAVLDPRQHRRRHADERPPPALDGQAALRLRLLLGLHGVLPVHAHLDRRHPRRDAVVPHAHVQRLEVRRLVPRRRSTSRCRS